MLSSDFDVLIVSKPIASLILLRNISFSISESSDSFSLSVDCHEIDWGFTSS
jgi:hypothetical protein